MANFWARRNSLQVGAHGEPCTCGPAVLLVSLLVSVLAPASAVVEVAAAVEVSPRPVVVLVLESVSGLEVEAVVCSRVAACSASPP